jgi:hypothetical protein
MGTGHEGHKQRGHSFLNILLTEFTTIINLDPTIHNEIEDDQCTLARALAHCSLLLLGTDALTPSIIELLGGANDIIHKTLGRPCSNLDTIRHCLVSVSKIAINIFHLWATTMTIVCSSSMTKLSPAILQVFVQPSEPCRIPPLPNTSTASSSGPNMDQHSANKPQNSAMDPTFITFKEAAVSWYQDLLLHGGSTTDTTGTMNNIFLAFGITPPSCSP